MKKTYIKPSLEAYVYRPEQGFAKTPIYLYKDYALIEGDDQETLRSADEVTEYTDENGEYTTGLWE
jgi:hypothetical protein